jgi:hypothetical protein
MIPPVTYAKLKVVESLGQLPHYSKFKAKEQVLVRFASGYMTLGTILTMPQMPKPGQEVTWYVYFRDKRYSHCRPLGGQKCQCFETGSRKQRQDWQPDSCPLHGVFYTQGPTKHKRQRPILIMPMKVHAINTGTPGIRPLGNTIPSPMKDTEEDPLW